MSRMEINAGENARCWSPVAPVLRGLALAFDLRSWVVLTGPNEASHRVATA